MDETPPPECKFDTSCRQDVCRLVKTIYGNGHPEDSLIVRVCNIEKGMATIKKLSWVTAMGVFGMISKLVIAWLEVAIKT